MFNLHGGNPILFFANPLDMHFRSSLNDNLLEQILRLSMQERGRTGTPPASQEAIKNLPEIKVTEAHCKRNENNG